MKTTFLKTTFLLVAILTFFNCSNNDDPQDQLPPITQTGANTFGCIINDEVLIPKNSNGIPNARGLEVFHKSNNNLIIDVNNYSDTNANGSIYIYIYNLTSIGNFSLGLSEGLTDFHFEPNYSHIWCRTFDRDTGSKKYISNSNSGTVNITQLDTTNNLVSGTFNNLTLINIDDPNDIIQITNGRFDINLNTVNN